VNYLGLYGFELTGANSFMYAEKHLQAHFLKEHGRNVNSIQLQGLLLQRKANTDTVNLPYVFYSIYALYMIFIRDFILFYKAEKQISKKQFIKLYVSKFIYFVAFIILPLLLIPFPVWQVIVALFLMYFVVTVLLLVILLMPTEKVEFGRMEDNYNENWAVEILEQNVDFSPGSTALNFLLGGANLNVVHYVFPNVNHVHYNKLANLIEKMAKRYRLIYRKQGAVDVLAIHLNYLRNIHKQDTELVPD
jgi:linoleoyl-CoA desaturase